MREIKFRAWDTVDKKISQMNENGIFPASFKSESNGAWQDVSLGLLVKRHNEGKTILIQYTGLKDKNGITEVYEGDIIDETGSIVGNIYEMDKRETDFVIQGLGTKAWCETYRRAILLGCRDAE